MRTIKRLTLFGVLAASAIACGGLADGGAGGGGGSGGGSAGVGGGGTAGSGSDDSAGGGGGTAGSGGTKGSGPDDASIRDGTTTGFDVALPPLDAALGSLDAAPPGTAGFAFIVNDVVQHPMDCAGVNWEFKPYPGTGGGGCMSTGPVDGDPCPGILSVILVNTGALDMAYIAGPEWSGPAVPGGYPGGDYGAGVLAPGGYADITSFYNAGAVAVVGSAEPFSSPEASYASDEGQIPWPLGVKGSGGATTMYVAQIEVFTACHAAEKVW